jgi:hypothetical protein
MKALFRIGTTLIAIVLLLITVVACGQTPGSAATQPATSKLTREQATAIAENALEAYNNGNYAAWSRDWSDTMKNGIKEPDFRLFRDELLRSKGKYVSIAGLELTKAKTAGFVRWVVTGNFEQGQVRFNFVFKQDGDKIEGVLPEPAS